MAVPGDAVLEADVLAALATDHAARQRVDELKPSDFWDRDHRELFTILRDLIGLDKGRVQSIEEIHGRISDESLFDWLVDTYGHEIDVSSFLAPELLENYEAIEVFESLANVTESESTFGVTKNGLALLLAYCIEIIQERAAV